MSTVQPFDPSVNLRQAVLWQYESAEKIKALTDLRQAWINQHHADFWADWYRDVFNVSTANDFGLAIWARILNIPLEVDNAAQPGKVPFGFGAFNRNFNNGNFGVQAGSTQALTTEQKRLVIRLRYFQLTSRCTVPEINEFLALAFGDGNAYVLDPQDMTFATYVFTFQVDSSLRFILEKYDLLPRPSTVGVQWISQQRPVFGFGIYNRNFNNGTFGA